MAVSLTVKRLVTSALTLVVCLPLFAYEVDPKIDSAVRDALPVCAGAEVQYQELPVALPAGFKGATVRVESPDHSCDGQFAAVFSPTGGFFLGSPWPIANEEGKTIEAKLASFTARAMQEQMTATVDRTKRTGNGLYKVTLTQVTEAGKLPISGEVDPQGNVFFFGQFRPAGDAYRASRGSSFDAFVANAPARGPKNAPVTIIEFSDFQCPSCMRASGYVEPILAAHGDKVRYVRYDLPLSGHAWAFPAALAGRAIHRQNPELFWEYKKQVYANQGELNSFTFWDWARRFAEDHELDLAKYDADLQSAAIREEILNGVGNAFSNEIRATPSYLVNGALVSAGNDGKALAEYVAKLLE